MSRWNKLIALSALQWAYLAASWMLLPIVDLALRSVGYQRTRRVLTRWSRNGHISKEANAAGVATDIAYVVGVAARYSVWPTSCLRQALLFWWFMARRGTPVEIRIGVESALQESFAAHAWVERDGHVVLGGEHARERYVVLL